MKKRKNGSFKDFLYDSMDYIMIFSIVLLVVGIISWRLNILFNDSSVLASEKVTNEIPKNKEKVIKNPKKEEDNKALPKKDLEGEKSLKEEDPSKEKSDKNIDADNKNNKVLDSKQAEKETNDKIKLSIPQGSDSSKIADILQASGAVEDAEEFLTKCETMEKSTKLKAGDFEIPKGSSLEDVINIITK